MSVRAEVSSITASLHDLAHRVTVLADSAQSDDDELLAAELYGVERALHGAERRLQRLEERPRG